MTSMRLSAQDAAFIYGEDSRIPLHVGCLAFVEASPLRGANGAIDIERLRAEISKRLHLTPMFRKKLAHVPFEQGRPVWIDDANFAIENHVHLTAVPKPGTRREVLDLMGRLQATLLDRHRPLWELTFVDGLAGGDRIAFMSKIHHAMIDGTSGVELGTLLFDLTAAGTPIEAREWVAHPEPSTAGLLFDALFERAGDAVRRTRKVVGALSAPGRPAAKALKFVRAMETFAGEFDRLPFNDRVGSRRCFEIVSVSLDSVLETRRVFGVTVNDVGLAAITGALRRYCEQSGIDPDELRNIRAICPVDNRVPGDKRPGSDVASMVVALPLDESDPERRVERVAACSRELKQLDVAEGSNMWARITSLLPVPLLRATSWLQFRGLMGNANLLVSNVRGPASPCYCFGAKVESFFPYFGVQDGIGLNVVLFSYAGRLLIGIAADPDLVPDVGAIAEGIEKAFEELAAAV